MANKRKLTDKYIRDLSAQSTRYRVWDTENPALLLEVLPTGRKVFRAYYRRNGKPAYSTIDQYGNITLAQARDAALKVRSKSRDGICPVDERRQAKAKAEEERQTQETQRALILKSFIDEVYLPDAKIRGMKSVDVTVSYIYTYFKDLLDTPINQIKIEVISSWQTAQIERGIKPATINRIVNALRGIVSVAFDKGYIEIHPLKKLKNFKEPESNRDRRLSDEEDQRLREQLEKRNTANLDILKRKGEALPEQVYADHLMPIVLLALNTGMRRGEIFQLRWEHVNMINRVITVKAEIAKSKKDRKINMNKEAFQVLTDWSNSSSRGVYVFPNSDKPKGKKEEPVNSIRRSWENILEKAEIEGFRFHDLRHTFASNLVSKGATLYMVQKLLGHGSLSMTMRYSHFSPDDTAKAVALLD